MKRLTALCLVFSFLLSGCALFGERIKDPVTFYYVRAEYAYSSTESVLGSEEREASGHRHDLSYLMALYLIGPSDEALVSPLPRGTRFYSIEEKENSLLLHLSDTAGVLSDSDFTIACACLTMTCLELTKAEEVTIISGERTVTMSRDNLTLFDTSIETQPSEDETQ